MQLRMIVSYCLTEEDGTDMFFQNFGKKLKLWALISVFATQFNFYVTVSYSSLFYKLVYVYNTFLCLPASFRSETPICTKILSSKSVRVSQSWLCIILWFMFPYIVWDIVSSCFLYLHGDLRLCGFMFDFKILYNLKILTTDRFRVNMTVSPEIVCDDTQENITQKISSQFIWQLHWFSEEASFDALSSEWCWFDVNF
jgi:hypothetical protein